MQEEALQSKHFVVSIPEFKRQNPGFILLIITCFYGINMRKLA